MAIPVNEDRHRRTDDPGAQRDRREGKLPKTENRMPPWPIAVFLLCLLIPWMVMIGPLNMSPARTFLTIFVVPGLIRWASGAAGPVRIPDLLLLGYAIWCSIALVANHGLDSAIQPSGILLIETIGTYLLARLYIRDERTFRNTFRFASLLILILLPFSVFEWLTGNKIVLDTFHSIAPTFSYGELEVRMGFRRVSSVFEHPILYGVFCASLISFLALDPFDGKKNKGPFLSFLMLFASMLSMSSAPWAAAITQVLLLCWNALMRSYALRWKILWGFVLLGYLVIEFGSNQTPVQFYISKFTMDQQTGWYRLWIWEFGSASVANNPLLGIGLNDWVRPKWMPSETIDNFWLVTAMRYGLPAFIMLALAILAISLGIARRMGKNPELDRCRTGYLICMFMFVFMGATVHFWGGAYLWYLFQLGAGVWMMEAAPMNEARFSSPVNDSRAASPRRSAREAPGGRERRPYRKAARRGVDIARD